MEFRDMQEIAGHTSGVYHWLPFAALSAQLGLDAATLDSLFLVGGTL